MNKESVKKFGVFCLAGLAAVSIAACKGNGDNSKNIIISEDKTKRVINLFSPMLLEQQQIKQLFWQKKNWAYQYSIILIQLRTTKIKHMMMWHSTGCAATWMIYIC